MYLYYLFYTLDGKRLVESFDDYTSTCGAMMLLQKAGASDIEFVRRKGD